MSHAAPPSTRDPDSGAAAPGTASATAPDAPAAPAAADSSAPAAEHDHDRRRWFILVVLGLAQLMVVLDATIVNIALPSAQSDIGFNNADRQWIVTAYSLAFGGLLLLGGRLSDLLGRRRTLLIGLLGFAAASALGGAAHTFELLVIARALQGALGALLAPSALSLLTITFTDPAARGKAFGIFGAIAGAGAAVGLLLGGALTEYLSWSWCLYVNVPIAIVAFIGALVLIPRVARNEGVHLDLPGTVTVGVGLAALVYGFARAETDGWTDTFTIASLVVAVVLLVVFVLLQRIVAHPLLPLRIVLDRRRGGSYLAMALTAIGVFAVFLFLTYYLQENKGYSPLKSGVAFLPMVGGIVTSSTGIVVRVLPRRGPRPLILTGAVLGCLGLLGLTTLSDSSNYFERVLPSLVLLGLGLGMIFGSAFNTATAGAQPQDAGVASAMVNTCQQVGGAIGTALLSTIAAQVTAGRLAGQQVTPQLQLEAAVTGYTHAWLVSAGIFLLIAVLAVVVIPGGRLPAPGESGDSPRRHGRHARGAVARA